MNIYKIIKNPTTQQDSLLYVGESRAEVIQALGQPNNISRNDDNDGDDLGYDDGIVLRYADNNLEVYDVLSIIPNDDGRKNPYVLSKKYKLGVGRPIPVALLNDCEYEVYTKASDKLLTATQEAAFPPFTWKQYSFYIAIKTGELVDSSLTIDVQDGKIIRIHIGGYS